DDREADGNEDVFDFLEDLANQVMGADGAVDAGERKVDAFASEGRLFGAGFDGRAARFNLRFDVGFELVLFSTDDGDKFARSLFSPVVTDQSQDAPFSTEPRPP